MKYRLHFEGFLISTRLRNTNVFVLTINYDAGLPTHLYLENSDKATTDETAILKWLLYALATR
jgi:hypothetical protein